MADALSSILIVEDDLTIRTLLDLALRGAGYRRVFTAARGDEGLAEARLRKPDLVLLDLMLPGLDGWSVCRAVRADASLAGTRILMLTARDDPADIVKGLDCGADDYVVKPFDRPVLLARVRALLRRGAASADAAPVDGLVFDPDAHTAVYEGAAIRLAPGESRILALLMRNRGRVLPRGRILDALQGDEADGVTERTVDVQIATLRRKLGAWAAHIETIRGVGYRMVPET
jgi:two-component system phosphate regulon response regulator PhoB